MKYIVSVLTVVVSFFFVFILFKVFSWLYEVVKARFMSWRSSRKKDSPKD